MSNQGHTRPGEFRKPLCELLPDLRKRITRYTAVTTGASLRDGLFIAWGTTDPAPATGPTAGFSGLRLIKQDVNELDGSNVLVQVYETIPATAEIQVGNNTEIELEDGRRAIEAEFVQFSAGTYAPGTVGTTTAPGDGAAFMQKAEETNDGTLRRIKRIYVYVGQIGETIEYNQGGNALIQVLTYVISTPPTPTGYTLIRSQIVPKNGIPVKTYTFAKGLGVVAVDIHSRQDGLREVTYISLGTRTAPGGSIVRDDYREADGYQIYTVSTMQTAAGGTTVTGATVSFERWVPFTYPGRAKAFSEVYASRTMLDVFKSPPVSTLVLATVNISYQTSNALGTISDFWNPSEWATMRAQWIGLGSTPVNLVNELPGYRSTSGTAVTATCSAFAPNDVSIFGNVVFGSTTAKITCTGGPSDPGGTTKTLSAEIELAFTDTSGTKYYRKTLVSSAIPAQSALPV